MPNPRHPNRDYLTALRRNPAGTLALIHGRKGEICRLIGDYTRATQSFGRMLTAAGFAGDANLKAEAVAQLGSVHLYKGELDQAEERYLEALKLYREQGHAAGQANCLKNLGKIMQYRERHQEAHGRLNEALAKYKECGDKDGEYSVLESMVEYYTAQKEYERSLGLLAEILDHYQGKGDIVKKGRAFQFIAKVQREKGDFQNSKVNFEIAQEIASRIGDNLGLIYILCEAGIAYFEKSLYDEAVKYFNDCLALALKHDVKYMQAVSLLNLGDSCAQLGRSEEARNHLGKMLSLNMGIKGMEDEAQRILNTMSNN